MIKKLGRFLLSLNFLSLPLRRRSKINKFVEPQICHPKNGIDFPIRHTIVPQTGYEKKLKLR